MKMIFETPATVWQEAFPLGNGRIGALMFGDGEAETLCLNEDTLWSGYPGDPCTGMGYEDIKKAEVYAKEGKYLQAAQVLNQAQETAEDVEMYEPFGTVRIRFEGEREIADYHRELDLETADVVAHEMKEWAIEKGATHYTHWFQPLTGVTAEKHLSQLRWRTVKC